jgi:hypothetical protein
VTVSVSRVGGPTTSVNVSRDGAAGFSLVVRANVSAKDRTLATRDLTLNCVTGVIGTSALHPSCRELARKRSYGDELRKNGHLVAEEPLQPANTAVTVYWKNGRVAVTDGPYAETKEQLGGILVLEARDLNHAIQLISQNPGVKLKCGLIEIRPAADLNEMMRESERRRRKDTRHL